MMSPKEFRALFSSAASSRGFNADHGGWFRESPESMVVLDLQKSNFGDHFALNIKVFVQGLFGERYTRSKDMVKKLTGNVFLRPPGSYNGVLDLASDTPPSSRQQQIQQMFDEFIEPLTKDALSCAGLKSLASRNLVHLLPAVREQLEGSVH